MKKGKTFTIMDRTTRWPEPYPSLPPPPPTAQSHSSRDGCSGSGCQRQSTVTGVPNLPLQYGPLCRLLNIQNIPTTAYYPQSNGLVERFHRRFKDALRARAAGNRWITHLPWVMFGNPVCMERRIRLLTSRSSVLRPAHPP